MKLGFFGGSFNPPTFAHLNILKESLKQLEIDRAFFVPVGNTYKKDGLINEKYRYDMLKIISEDENNIDVEDIELNTENEYKAIDIFKLIKEKYNKDEIYFIMGADNFIKILEWKEYKELIENYKYIIFERNNIKINDFIKENQILKENKNNFKILNLKKYNDISSNIIRSNIKKGKYNLINKYTKEEVVKYIKNNNLYV